MKPREVGASPGRSPGSPQKSPDPQVDTQPGVHAADHGAHGPGSPGPRLPPSILPAAVGGGAAPQSPRVCDRAAGGSGTPAEAPVSLTWDSWALTVPVKGLIWAVPAPPGLGLSPPQRPGHCRVSACLRGHGSPPPLHSVLLTGWTWHRVAYRRATGPFPGGVGRVG